MIDIATIKEFSKRTGITEHSIRGRIKRGAWQRGKQYSKTPDNRIIIRVQEAEKWLLGEDA